jgi:hypothetical protein
LPAPRPRMQGVATPSMPCASVSPSDSRARSRARRRASRTRRPPDDRVVPFLGRPTLSCDARRPRPKGRGWPGAWLCQLAHPMAPHRPSLSSSPCIPASLRRGYVLGSDGLQGATTPQAGPCRGNPHLLRRQRGRKGLGATCVVPAPRKGAHPVVVAAPRILGSDPGRAPGALLPGPERIREGTTIPCREHGEEGRQGRRPAQGQPGGPPRLGRLALLGLVADDTTSPPRPASRCIPRRGRRARDPPRVRPLPPSLLRAAHAGFSTAC